MRLFVLLGSAFLALIVAPFASGDGRDDTAMLQARLDQGGGQIFLPKLPNGECYATRGLWVSHDDTEIASDGACIRALGHGEVRLKSSDGRRSDRRERDLYVARSNVREPTPWHVTIRGLTLDVPADVNMFGLVIFGHEVTVRDMKIEGSPIDDITIGFRGNSNAVSDRARTSSRGSRRPRRHPVRFEIRIREFAFAPP